MSLEKMDFCNPYYEDAVWSFYRYVPSQPAAIVFCILYVITTIIHIVQILRTRSWYLMALVSGGVCTYLSKIYLTVSEIFIGA